MNKKISLGIAVALMALTAAACFIITYNYSMDVFNSKVKSVSEKEGTYSKLAELDKFVRSSYINDIDEESLMHSIMHGYVGGLEDFYAEFYSADEYAQIIQKDSGVITGLGFDYEKEESGYIRITGVSPNTSASEAGLVAGDIITAVNNTDVIAYDNGYDEAVSFFKCEAGTKVRLHVRREGIDLRAEFLTFDLIAAENEIISVTSYLISDIGYIKITLFNEKTPSQFKAALDELISSGAESLIFDVRGNPGGTVDSLQEVLDCLLGNADVITAFYRDTKEVIVKTTEAEEIKLPMTVLINEASASCSELFAAALRDNTDAEIVGVTSFGKSVMQTTHKLSGGEAVRITTASLQTSQSGDFNGIGIKPEFEVPLDVDIDIDAMDMEELLLYDTQLIKAVEVATTIK